ncbi:MAG: TetR family transcriptional regulator [Candidatus Cloacimonadota bacterium]|nr:MAG: TetR family transcriptional regulator [Candidatus Cloacimonadota bacterium]
MRVKDEEKQQALFEATIKLVNEIGFVSSSVAKIAKEANVSPATLYIYHENKVDLLVNTYLQIKKSLSLAILEDFAPEVGVKKGLKLVWRNMFQYISKHNDYFQFTEQFSNCPYASLINKEEVDSYFLPVLILIEKGIKDKIIKDIDFDMIICFLVAPVLHLANPKICCNFVVNEESINIGFELAWDAISCN